MNLPLGGVTIVKPGFRLPRYFFVRAGEPGQRALGNAVLRRRHPHPLLVDGSRCSVTKVGTLLELKRLIRARLSTWHQRCRMSPDRFAWLKMRRTFSGGVFLWVVAIAAAVVANTAAAGNKVELDSFSVHLFLEDSGAVSRDITKITDFHSWNFKSDEGKADAILIKIRFRSDGEAFAKGEQSKVIVTTHAKRHDGSNRIITSEL